jgi:hypothetical protein
MRGKVREQRSLVMVGSVEQRIPESRPIREVKMLADRTLGRLGKVFEAMYAEGGRPSVPPERLLSSEHFSVDGTLIEAWASMKSFRLKDEPKDGPPSDSNGWSDFKGTKRKNDTHASSTDPEARLARKGSG